MIHADVRLALGWPPGLLLGCLAAVAVVLLERRAGRGLAPALLRLSIAMCLGLAVARPTLEIGRGGAMVVVVEPGAESGGVATVAGSAGVTAPWGHEDAQGMARIAYGASGGPDLAAALDLARRAVSDGGRIVVVGSGSAPGVDPEGASARARASGVRVDAVPVAPRGPDAAVTEVEVPGTWRVGQPVPVGIAVRSSEPVTGTVVIEAQGQPVERVPVSVPGGGAQAVVRVEIDAGDAATLVVEAEVRVDGDMEPRNDRVGAAVALAEPPTVMVVGRDEGAILLADALSERGGRIEVRDPSRFPARLSALEPYDVVAFVDVSAESLGLDQMSALEAFAGQMGRGVLLTAGRQSFLAGGWEATPLADIAPVDMEPPERDSREAVAFLLMLDQSASMGTVEGRAALSKLDLAREAAALSIEVLHPGDTVGVVAYDEEARWLVPLRAISDAADLIEVESDLRGLVSGGGTRIASALELGLPALAAIDVPTRHAVLISDGRDFAAGVAGTEDVVRDARLTGATLSTIAIGFDADRALLEGLARSGRGRFHQADAPSELPRLAVEESEILRSRSEQSGEFAVLAAGGSMHPALGGVDPTRLPPITGYVAVRPRDGADAVLVTTAGDPLLATWNYGLGRVAAWMSDAGEDWAWEWASDAEARLLLGRLAGYLAPAPLGGPPGVRTEVAQSVGIVEADARDRQGLVVDLADATLAISSSGGSRVVSLPQVAPGLYAAEVTLPVHPAVGLVTVRDDGGSAGAAVSLVARPGLGLGPDADGAERIAHLAEAGGGTVVEGIAAPGAGPRSLRVWPWLLMAAALLWPVDVAEQLGYRLLDPFGRMSRRLRARPGRRTSPTPSAD